MNNKAIVAIVAKARAGVEYGINGAACPCCGERALVHTTTKKRGICVRYHKCKNPKCLLHQLGVDIKSVQATFDDAA